MYGSPEAHPSLQPQRIAKHWTGGKIALFVTGLFLAAVSSAGTWFGVFVLAGALLSPRQDTDQVGAIAVLVLLFLSLLLGGAGNILIGIAAYQRRS